MSKDTDKLYVGDMVKITDEDWLDKDMWGAAYCQTFYITGITITEGHDGYFRQYSLNNRTGTERCAWFYRDQLRKINK